MISGWTKIPNRTKASVAYCLNDIAKVHLNAWKYFIDQTLARALNTIEGTLFFRLDFKPVE